MAPDESNNKGPTAFTIDYILNDAGKNIQKVTSFQDLYEFAKLDNNRLAFESHSVVYDWVKCTRQHPPKLQRNNKKEAPKKRKLGRLPRIPFTTMQTAELERKYRESAYISTNEVNYISERLSLPPHRVKIWFQNRRAREKREKSGSDTSLNNDSTDSIESESTQPLILGHAPSAFKATLPADFLQSFRQKVTFS